MAKTLLTRNQVRIGAAGIDVTVKSAQGVCRHFAPTWDMVMGHKNGAVTTAQYTEKYLAILDNAPQSAWDWLKTEGTKTGEITFLCYCPNPAPFCHTHLLMEYAAKKFPLEFEITLDIV